MLVFFTLGSSSSSIAWAWVKPGLTASALLEPLPGHVLVALLGEQKADVVMGFRFAQGLLEMRERAVDVTRLSGRHREMVTVGQFIRGGVGGFFQQRERLAPLFLRGVKLAQGICGLRIAGLRVQRILKPFFGFGAAARQLIQPRRGRIWLPAISGFPSRRIDRTGGHRPNPRRSHAIGRISTANGPGLADASRLHAVPGSIARAR